MTCKYKLPFNPIVTAQVTNLTCSINCNFSFSKIELKYSKNDGNLEINNNQFTKIILIDEISVAFDIQMYLSNIMLVFIMYYYESLSIKLTKTYRFNFKHK